MKGRLCTASVVPVFLLAALWPFSASIASEDLGTDHGLLAFVLHNDTVLVRVLGTCRDVSIVRSGGKGRVDFNVTAECTIKDNREENMDCPAYKVDASGTVDSPTQATVRKMTLNLLCSA
ncbi:hypothetical protein SAMN05216570_3404 [Dyella sp. OK004]|uniref:hypothetical protein n=1 Tax=Dyella sp. OK004 TaxID=1855292 RepID=UPI0008F2B336|nr:hypothetical protein [Dyella sp. OK004]SFS16875.1 hypothetical protein SAMN05216570_3404 [Dyella sp. OK004]